MYHYQAGWGINMSKIINNIKRFIDIFKRGKHSKYKIGDEFWFDEENQIKGKIVTVLSTPAFDYKIVRAGQDDVLVIKKSGNDNGNNKR